MCACLPPARSLRTAAFCILGIVAPASALADDAEALYRTKVRPVFEAKCYECHSAKADEIKGNLKLDSVEDILKGGDNGPAVRAGDVENSFLLRAIRYQEDDYQMPPAGRLEDNQIRAIEAWVKALGRDDDRATHVAAPNGGH
jgi:mono/diheme cytochrome c family protein